MTLALTIQREPTLPLRLCAGSCNLLQAPASAASGVRSAGHTIALISMHDTTDVLALSPPFSIPSPPPTPIGATAASASSPISSALGHG
ncbi:hypothetical protein DFH07DRAFT_954787 [Mycena maculata]|uniref:Uncharacterized protein n=1 Tax=Mycena maculata TaxID=230809 RepID=A0AAD7JM91_9AGAR|nr:hypothetical protein DFH07DRAFT_974776 [Mycena maculata]KAJ7759815.1 hypothetical protein DFH07DRAFT_957931 [Mycena maculata]KAJ7767896.1 hypothetical protein DFH07DRAFT_954787 [Mycena maculata]